MSLTPDRLCFIHEVDLDDKRPVLEQSVHDVDLSDVIKIRSVSLTNKTRKETPEYMYNVDDIPYHLLEQSSQREINTYIEDHCRMCLRWVFIKEFADASERLGHKDRPNNCVSWTLRRLNEDECQKGKSKSAEYQRLEWHNVSTPEPVGDIEEIDQDEFDLRHGLRSLLLTGDLVTGSRIKYTFADICKPPSPSTNHTNLQQFVVEEE